MLEYRSWDERDGNVDLRDAWLASQEFISNCDWSALQANCGLCEQVTSFRLKSNAVAPDLREALVCERCGFNSRIRAALRLLLDLLPPAIPVKAQGWHGLLRRRQAYAAPMVYTTEQATPAYVWLQKNLPGTVQGSEFEPNPIQRAYLGQALLRMGGWGPVRFQDITRLDLADASLDAVVSFDVLEHVPDYPRAISEFARVLKPGGHCIATFPFNDLPDTLVRARLGPDDVLEHLEPAEYHGNPIGVGILCFYHFGWDILERFRAAGFTDARMVMPYSLEKGLAYGMWTLVARR